ncbi:MAG: hypothetical protein IKJ11_04900 [Clostridia bacterium]|nr:hypothetical protein [Clostridia bacterium]
MKQLRVPEYRENESESKFLKALVAFLKELCSETWTDSRMTAKKLSGIRYPVTSVNGKAGDVQLNAQDVGARPDTWTPSAKDVGARPDTWTPSASDVGALPSGGTAADAGKLGGKDPAFYTPYTNIADNSDFTKWVAQAGIGGAHGAQAYGGDRWKLTSGTITGEKNADGDGYSNITLNGTLTQIVPSPPALATPFIEMISGTAEISYDAESGEIVITSSGGVIKNVLLLEGEWTVKPEYVSKGYGAELTECQRYYWRWIPSYTAAALGFAINWTAASARTVIYLPVTMRNQGVLPSVNFKNMYIAYRASSKGINPTAFTVMAERENVLHLGMAISSGTTGEGGYLISADTTDAYVEVSKDL